MGIAAPLRLLLILVAAVILVVRRLRPGRRMTLTVGPNQHPGVVTVARHTRVFRLLGALAGLLAAVALAMAGDAWLGRVMLLAPMAVGAGALLGVIVGEWTARSPLPLARTASLRRRTLGAVLPRSSAVQLGVGVVGVVAVLITGSLMASPDDLGRPGRALTRVCTAVQDGQIVELASSRGPWPGSYYTIPAALAVLVVLVLATVAARVVVGRRRPSAEDAALDDQLRRWSVMSVAAATGVTLRLTAAPLALAMAMILFQNVRFGDCRYAWDRPLSWVLLGLAGYWLVTGLTALVELFVGPRIVIDEQSRPTPPAESSVPVR